MFINVFLIAACCQLNVWNGIVPLKSTRSDVEKVLGKPVAASVGKHAAFYETAGERVSILYSTGPCTVKPSHGWNVPELAVIDILVKPHKKPNLVDFKFDMTKFERHGDPEIRGLVYYTNEEDGISITVNETDATIEYVKYFPRLKDDRFRCPRPG